VVIVSPVAPVRCVAWDDLPARARLWRVLHASWSIGQLASLAYVWGCVLLGRRNDRLWATVSFLLVEGGALVVGRGNCPMGARQEQWGDPVPFFELILPPRAAKAAIPALTFVSIAALVGVVVRRPRLVRNA
jgi:hypothetical protein